MSGKGTVVRATAAGADNSIHDGSRLETGPPLPRPGVCCVPSGAFAALVVGCRVDTTKLSPNLGVPVTDSSNTPEPTAPGAQRSGAADPGVAQPDTARAETTHVDAAPAQDHAARSEAVSYTHLTLPTILLV